MKTMAITTATHVKPLVEGMTLEEELEALSSILKFRDSILQGNDRIPGLSVAPVNETRQKPVGVKQVQQANGLPSKVTSAEEEQRKQTLARERIEIEKKLAEELVQRQKEQISEKLETGLYSSGCLLPSSRHSETTDEKTAEGPVSAETLEDQTMSDARAKIQERIAAHLARTASDEGNSAKNEAPGKKEPHQQAPAQPQRRLISYQDSPVLQKSHTVPLVSADTKIEGRPAEMATRTPHKTPDIERRQSLSSRRYSPEHERERDPIYVARRSPVFQRWENSERYIARDNNPYVPPPPADMDVDEDRRPRDLRVVTDLPSPMDATAAARPDSVVRNERMEQPTREMDISPPLNPRFSASNQLRSPAAPQPVRPAPLVLNPETTERDIQMQEHLYGRERERTAEQVRASRPPSPQLKQESAVGSPTMAHHTPVVRREASSDRRLHERAVSVRPPPSRSAYYHRDYPYAYPPPLPPPPPGPYEAYYDPYRLARDPYRDPYMYAYPPPPPPLPPPRYYGYHYDHEAYARPYYPREPTRPSAGPLSPRGAEGYPPPRRIRSSRSRSPEPLRAESARLRTASLAPAPRIAAYEAPQRASVVPAIPPPVDDYYSRGIPPPPPPPHVGYYHDPYRYAREPSLYVRERSVIPEPRAYYPPPMDDLRRYPPPLQPVHYSREYSVAPRSAEVLPGTPRERANSVFRDRDYDYPPRRISPPPAPQPLPTREREDERVRESEYRVAPRAPEYARAGLAPPPPPATGREREREVLRQREREIPVEREREREYQRHEEWERERHPHYRYDVPTRDYYEREERGRQRSRPPPPPPPPMAPPRGDW